MKITLLLLVLFIPLFANAQIEATTNEGKKVLLFEDGTWEYVTQENVQTLSASSVDIKEGLTIESPLSELYYAESKRLVKYFGKIKGRIKGRAKCMFVDGQPKIFFQWEVALIDGHRYFGQMKEGKKITLKTKNNTPVELILTEGVKIEFLDKYNYSIFKGAASITQDQLNLLINSPVSQMEVEWKKESEGYPLLDPYYFSKTFNDLIK